MTFPSHMPSPYVKKVNNAWPLARISRGASLSTWMNPAAKKKSKQTPCNARLRTTTHGATAHGSSSGRAPSENNK